MSLIADLILQILSIDEQDIDALEWPRLQSDIRIKIAQGTGRFDIYEGRVVLDNREFIGPVHVGKDLPEILIGVKWLKLMRLTVDYQRGILTLECTE